MHRLRRPDPALRLRGTERATLVGPQHRQRLRLIDIAQDKFEFTDLDERDQHGFRAHAPLCRCCSGGRPTGSRRRAASQCSARRPREPVRPTTRSRRASASPSSPFEGQWLRAAYRQDAPTCPSRFTLVAGDHRRADAQCPAALARRPYRHAGPALGCGMDAAPLHRRRISEPGHCRTSTSRSPTLRRPRDRQGAHRAPRRHGQSLARLTASACSARSARPTSGLRSDEARGAMCRSSPDNFARAGVTFVHPSRIKLTVATNLCGDSARATSRAATRGLLDDGCGHHLGNARPPPVVRPDACSTFSTQIRARARHPAARGAQSRRP